MEWGPERARRRAVLRDTAFSIVLGLILGLAMIVVDLAGRGAL